MEAPRFIDDRLTPTIDSLQNILSTVKKEHSRSRINDANAEHWIWLFNEASKDFMKAMRNDPLSEIGARSQKFSEDCESLEGIEEDE